MSSGWGSFLLKHLITFRRLSRCTLRWLSLSTPQWSQLIVDAISDVTFCIQSKPRCLCVLPLERRSVTRINRAGPGSVPGYVTLWTTMSLHFNFVTFPSSELSVLFRHVSLMSFGFSVWVWKRFFPNHLLSLHMLFIAESYFVSLLHLTRNEIETPDWHLPNSNYVYNILYLPIFLLLYSRYFKLLIFQSQIVYCNP